MVIFRRYVKLQEGSYDIDDCITWIVIFQSYVEFQDSRILAINTQESTLGI